MSLQRLDLSAIESAEPDMRHPIKKRKKMHGDSGGGRRPASEFDEELAVTKAKYQRGDKVSMAQVKDKKLKSSIATAEKKFALATSDAARAEILLPAEAGFLQAEGMNRTYKFSQQSMAPHLDVQTQKKVTHSKHCCCCCCCCSGPFASLVIFLLFLPPQSDVVGYVLAWWRCAARG